MNFLEKIRYEEMLQKENIRIIDVAYEIGYENIRYFHRIFKRITGVSPLSYRKISK
jgi:two-component system response regulator YesN